MLQQQFGLFWLCSNSSQLALRMEFTPTRDSRGGAMVQPGAASHNSYGFERNQPTRVPVGLVRSPDELRLTTTATFPPFRGRILLLTRRGKSLKLFRRIV